MTFHPRDASALETLLGDGRRLLGDRLLAMALYGEAATEAYRPRKSLLETVLLVERVLPTDLRLLRDQMDAWYRHRLATPLLVDPDYLRSSRDVFPLELLELRDRHRLLHGASDPFAALPPPNPTYLRLELEEQVKGKLLHLRETYVALGVSGRGLDTLLATTRGPFDVILRGLLYLADRPRPARLADVVEAVAAAYGLRLPAFALLERWHLGDESLTRNGLEETFAGVHDELSALAERIDRR
jgi:hypothetical protein